MRSDAILYELIIKSDCFHEISDVDESKVYRARKGVRTTTPSSRIGIVAWTIAQRAYAQETPPQPVPPPPPLPNPTVIAPRTFNKEGTSDSRYCITGLPVDNARGGIPYDDFTHYDWDGRDVDGGRDKEYQSKKEDGTPLRGAKTMDTFGPCDLYDGLKEWPPDSYHR